MNDQKLGQDHYHHYASPDSTLSSGYGDYCGGFHHEENLPEVRVDNSPQALSNPEAQFKRQYFEEQEPKYPVILDDAPKVFLSEESLPSESPATTAVEPSHEAQERRILGLKRRIFFIVLVVALIIIAIAVGGGVGGAMSSKSKSKVSAVSAPAVSTSSEASSSTAAPAVVSQSTTTSISVSTTKTNSPSPSPTIQFLNNQTTPSTTFAFQGFSSFSYGGNATSIIHSEGGTNFPFELNSYVWLPNTTSCCVSFCVNDTNAGLGGWWCDERYQPSASGPFGRIFVWCGESRTNANAVCV